VSADLVVRHRALRLDGMRRGSDVSHDSSVKQRSQSHASMSGDADVDDEDGGAVVPIVGGIGENTWRVGSRWVAPPSASDYKAYFKGEMARKFSLLGGTYPVKVHALLE